MPGYVIHLAIGEEYIKKYKNDIKNKYEFLKGIIQPDQLEDKKKAHYGPKKELKSMILFLEDKKEHLDKDFYKGYFLHLYADYLMYFKYLPDIYLYDDYDKTNKYVTEKYNVKLPKKLSKYGNHVEGLPQYLTYDFLDKFIEEVTNKKIKDIIEQVKGAYYEHKN